MRSHCWWNRRKVTPTKITSPSSAVVILLAALGLTACCTPDNRYITVKPEVPASLMNYTSPNL